MNNYKRNKKHLVCVLPNWLHARQTLGCFNNLRKYYPDLPIIFVDDEYSEEAVNIWRQVYHKEGFSSVFDPDSSKLIGLPNTSYIRHPHKGIETEGHGNAITNAMPLIHAKWILHVSSDVRLVEEGVLEYLFEELTDKFCGAGDRHKSKEGWDNVAKELCLYRGDLYHKYGLHFRGGGKEFGGHIDCGTIMYRDLVAKGYKMKYCDPSPYFTHLRASHPRFKELY